MEDKKSSKKAAPEPELYEFIDPSKYEGLDLRAKPKYRKVQVKGKLNFKQRAAMTRFHKQEIRLLGYATKGSPIQAVVITTVDKYGWLKNYAYTTFEDNEYMMFFEESVWDGVYEPCLKVPTVVWRAFDLKYNLKLKEVQETYLSVIAGAKMDKLRKYYTHDPFLFPSASPWWDKFKKIKHELIPSLERVLARDPDDEQVKLLWDDAPILQYPVEPRKAYYKRKEAGLEMAKKLFKERYRDPSIQQMYKDKGL